MKKIKKVLLLNPPGDKIYIRDYYCSKVSKTFYTYHPTDLLVLSGILKDMFQLKVIDAISEKLSFKKCMKRIIKFAPDAIIFLSGSVSMNNDFEFLTNLNARLNTPKKRNTLFIGTGDLFMEASREFFDHVFLDAILLDFTTDDIVKYLQGKTPNANMMYRKQKRLVKRPVPRPVVKNIKIPVPRYDLFPNRKYRYPFIRKYPFATVLTDYGCPFKCTFCIMSRIGFKLRSIENVIEELKYLKKNGFKNIYFNDQTFGANKSRTKELLHRMIEEKLSFGWICFSRVDVTDEKMLQLMKKAGCHTIMYGVESGSQKILNKYQKEITKERIQETFANAKKLGIRTFATFIIGLPGETKADVQKTIDFAKKINPHFVGFNTAVPRIGTKLREETIKQGIVKDELIEMDQSGSFTAMNTKQLSGNEIQKLQKRATIEFYLRPKYFTQAIASIKSFKDLWTYMANGLSLFRKILN